MSVQNQSQRRSILISRHSEGLTPILFLCIWDNVEANFPLAIIKQCYICVN
ncbi:MAG: hypothetical protein ACI865_003386 [Flavobacteriaceae bacterium]|jgi:hypothetical protein